MKPLLYFALLSFLLSCNNQNSQDMNTPQEVPERTNFGLEHTLVTSPY